MISGKTQKLTTKNCDYAILLALVLAGLCCSRGFVFVFHFEFLMMFTFRKYRSCYYCNLYNIATKYVEMLSNVEATWEHLIKKYIRKLTSRPLSMYHSRTRALTHSYLLDQGESSRDCCVGTAELGSFWWEVNESGGLQRYVHQHFSPLQQFLCHFSIAAVLFSYCSSDFSPTNNEWIKIIAISGVIVVALEAVASTAVVVAVVVVLVGVLHRIKQLERYRAIYSVMESTKPLMVKRSNTSNRWVSVLTLRLNWSRRRLLRD